MASARPQSPAIHDPSKAHQTPSDVSPSPSPSLATQTPAAPPPNALAVRQAGGLAVPDFEPAALARSNANIPAEFLSLGELPWEHYWNIEKGAIFRGVLVSLVKRFEEEEDEETGEKRVRIRRTFVARATVPTQCSRKIRSDDTRPILGTIVERNPDNAVPDKFDVYTVPAGTLVAFDHRQILMPFVPMAMGKNLYEIFLMCTGRQAVKDPKKAAKGHRYWAFEPGARLIAGKERDTSIDYLNQQADMTRKLTLEATEEVPF